MATWMKGGGEIRGRGDQGEEASFGGDRYVPYLGAAAGFKCVYMCQNIQ